MVKIYDKDTDETKHSFVEMAAYFPGLILLLLMLVLPAAYQEIKIAFLVVIIFQILLITFVSGHIYVHPIISLFFIFYLTIGSAYGAYGVFRGNVGAIPVTKEIVFYVFIYMFLISGIRSNYCIYLIHSTLCLATFILCVYIIESILYSLDLIPNWLYVDLYQNTTGLQAVGLVVLDTRGSIGIDISSLPSLLFLQPYLITHAIIDHKRLSIFSLFLILLATSTMLISGKRIMQIVGLASPLVIGVLLLFFNKLLFTRIKGLVFVMILYFLMFSVLLYTLGFDFHLMAQYVVEGITFSDPMESNVRIDQFYALLNGWIQNPILGAGSGAVQWAYLRSFEEPWNYELSYMKLLFDFGLVGVALYGIGVLFIWFKSVRMYVTHYALGKYALAAAIGSISFMVGNATNPFLLKFDYLVTLFLPLALINLGLLNRQISGSEILTKLRTTKSI